MKWTIAPEQLRVILAYAASATAAEVTRYSQTVADLHPDRREFDHMEHLSWIAGRAVQSAIECLGVREEQALEPIYSAVHEIIDCVGHVLRERLMGTITCLATITWWPSARGGPPPIAVIVEERLLLLLDELLYSGQAVEERRAVVA
jgi:hypothetical protein